MITPPLLLRALLRLKPRRRLRKDVTVEPKETVPQAQPPAGDYLPDRAALMVDETGVITGIGNAGSSWDVLPGEVAPVLPVAATIPNPNQAEAQAAWRPGAAWCPLTFFSVVAPGVFQRMLTSYEEKPAEKLSKTWYAFCGWETARAKRYFLRLIMYASVTDIWHLTSVYTGWNFDTECGAFEFVVYTVFLLDNFEVQSKEIYGKRGSRGVFLNDFRIKVISTIDDESRMQVTVQQLRGYSQVWFRTSVHQTLMAPCGAVCCWSGVKTAIEPDKYDVKSVCIELKCADGKQTLELRPIWWCTKECCKTDHWTLK